MKVYIVISTGSRSITVHDSIDSAEHEVFCRYETLPDQRHYWYSKKVQTLDSHQEGVLTEQRRALDLLDF